MNIESILIEKYGNNPILEEMVNKFKNQKRKTIKETSFIYFYELFKIKPSLYVFPFEHFERGYNTYSRCYTYRCEMNINGLLEFLKIYYKDECVKTDSYSFQCKYDITGKGELVFHKKNFHRIKNLVGIL